MYLANKYSSWYYSIIQSAKFRKIEKNLYFEIHHIIPKSLGGTNLADNLVKLTPKEHYICHRLLTKMTENLDRRKMIYALWCMVNVKNSFQKRYRVSARQYALIKQEQMNTRLLYKHSAEAKAKISAAHKGKIVSIETKNQMSKSAICRGSTNTAESIEKAKATRIKNNTTNSINSPNSIAKRMETKRKKGNQLNGILATQTVESRKKAAESRRKTYMLTDPLSNVFIVSNLTEFCKINKLSSNGLIQVASGNLPHYKKWKCERIQKSK